MRKRSFPVSESSVILFFLPAGIQVPAAQYVVDDSIGADKHQFQADQVYVLVHALHRIRQKKNRQEKAEYGCKQRIDKSLVRFGKLADRGVQLVSSSVQTEQTPADADQTVYLFMAPLSSGSYIHGWKRNT